MPNRNFTLTPSRTTRRRCVLDPDLPEAHNNLAWLYATCEDQKYRDPKAALEHASSL